MPDPMLGQGTQEPRGSLNTSSAPVLRPPLKTSQVTASRPHLRPPENIRAIPTYRLLYVSDTCHYQRILESHGATILVSSPRRAATRQGTDMTKSIVSFRGESTDGAPKGLEPLWTAAQRSSDRETLDSIADADKLVMQRLFQDVFRSCPVTSGA